MRSGGEAAGGVLRIGRIILGALLVAGSLAAMGFLTRFDYRAGTDQAALRLVWRTPAPRVVECREPTAEELADLPVHMRQDEICEGRALRYRLEVRVDGVVRHRSLAGAAGARSDRPLYVFEAIGLAPGPHEVQVLFERTEPRGQVADGSGAATVPARLVLQRTVDVSSRDVVLVTYDADRRTLVLR